MASFQEALEKAKRLNPQRVRTDLFNFIRTLEAELAELNRIALNQRSQDVEGKPIGFYSEATEYITLNNALLGKGNKIKKAGDPFDLDDTGVFLKSIFAKVNRDSILFGSTDPKLFEILKNTLSNDLFGLQDADLQNVIENRIRPYIITYFKQKLLR